MNARKRTKVTQDRAEDTELATSDPNANVPWDQTVPTDTPTTTLDSDTLYDPQSGKQTEETRGGMPQPYGSNVARDNDATYLDNDARAEEVGLTEVELRVEDLLLEAIDNLNSMLVGENSHHKTALDRIRRVRNLLGNRDEDEDESDEEVQARADALLNEQQRQERAKLRAEQKALRK